MENTYNEDFYIPKDKLSKSQKLVRYYFKNMGSLFPNSSKRLFWKLFTTPRKRKPSTSQQEFIKKAVSVSIKTQLLSTVYYAHHFGQGNKIVLLCHGWEGMTADFKGLIDFFISNNYKVISLDFPGHGASPKSQAHLPLFIDVIKDFITFHSNNIQFASLIGHSLGAAALSLAIPDMDKNRFERVILLGLHPKPSDFILQYKSITQIKSTLFTKCIQYAEKKVKVALMNYDCAHYTENYNQYPILFVHDEKDAVINVRRIKEFAEKVPSSQLFIGNHGGHFKHYKHPEVIKAIWLFVNAN